MAQRPWMKFYPSDWQSDEALRMCSLAARGLWVELVALAHKSDQYGHVLIASRVPTARQLAVLCGATDREVATLLRELEEAGVFDRGAAGEIVSRRMVRDEKRAAINRANGRNGGNPDLVKSDIPAGEVSVNRRANRSVNGGDKAQWPLASGLSTRDELLGNGLLGDEPFVTDDGEVVE